VQDVREHVLSAPVLYLLYEGEVCTAFAAMANLMVENTKILYLGGLMVEKSRQGRGLMKSVVDCEINQLNPPVLAARTQNPCMLDLMKQVCNSGELYPYCGAPRGKCRLILPGLTKLMGMTNLDPETLIGTGTYGRCLYGGGVPQSRHEESNRFFSQIDSQKGDSILFIGRAK